MASNYLLFLGGDTYELNLSAWITTLESAINAYMDRSLRAICSTYYFPAGWS